MSSGEYESKLYADRNEAEDALSRLRDIGYGEKSVSLVLGKDALPVDQNFPSDTSPLAASGTMGGRGTLVGATAGGLLGALVAGATSATLIIMTEGAALPFVAGPVVAALGGFGAGAVGGVIVGGLLELGIEAEDWKTELERGAVGVIVALKSRDDKKLVRNALMNW